MTIVTSDMFVYVGRYSVRHEQVLDAGARQDSFGWGLCLVDFRLLGIIVSLLGVYRVFLCRVTYHICLAFV